MKENSSAHDRFNFIKYFLKNLYHDVVFLIVFIFTTKEAIFTGYNSQTVHSVREWTYSCPPYGPHSVFLS